MNDYTSAEKGQFEDRNSTDAHVPPICYKCGGACIGDAWYFEGNKIVCVECRDINK